MADELVKGPPEDFLDRTAFLQALHRHIDDLAAVPTTHLAAPRVLVVDAPWGFGKSWIAQRLHAQLVDKDPSRATLIDAFRHDHHDDVFGVIAASMMAALKPKGEKRRPFLSKAGIVLQVVTPLIVKGAAGIALKMVNFDPGVIADAVESVKDGAIDGVGSLSNKAVEQMFERYSKTEQQQKEFQAALGDLTNDLPKPFVVVIDELDRCRPSFALECLERIKHLFSAENVVFVLFWNSRSIHESIRHTYGAGTDAAAYLSKFLSLSLRLELPRRNRQAPESSYRAFIEKEMARTSAGHDSDFEQALSELAAALNASLRDVQKAISLFATAAKTGIDGANAEFAYLALLLALEPSRFAALLASESTAIRAESKRLPWPSLEGHPTDLTYIWAHLTYRAKPDYFDQLASQGGTPDKREDAEVISLLGLGELQRHHRRANLLDQVGQGIRKLLATPVSRTQ